jgi:hypothetical protein
MHYLHPQHLEELVEDSGIDLHIASLNFSSLQDNNAYDYLLISDQIPRTNTGMVKNSWLNRYTHVTSGGWWCSGLDPLNDWLGMEWGCFKPDQPRQNEKGKCIKYEHPPSTATRVFYLRVTQEVWLHVAQRYNLSIPENINIVGDGEAVGFWQWVMDVNIPVIICEGAKKAAALLTQGYVAIAVPGITSGYRVAKNNYGQVMSRQLIPDLAAFAHNQRTFYICFDFETEPRKIAAVDNAIAQLGCLFQAKNCPVKVIKLPGVEKGVDEFLLAQGINAFDLIYRQSVDLEIYLAQTKSHTNLTVSPALTLNRRYLGEISFPSSGLVGVKSAKGTGKTTTIQGIITKSRNQPVLLITHRIQLGRFLCDKIGIPWGIGLQEQKLNIQKNTHSLGLCIDSIWKLNPEDWQGAIVILDEVEQSLWHLLNSNTCKDKRVKIINTFQKLISTVLTTGGLVIAQDADLSDISLEYLQELAGTKVTPWIVNNEWTEQGWNVTFYDSPNPTPLIQQLELDLLAGRKCYITTDSRSGRYSCDTIERYLKERLEKLYKLFPKTLVVSSHTTNTPGHQASDFVANINQKVFEYDAVFVTPSLGTGVSIDVQHFDRVYGIFQGVIPDAEARQALARVRDDVPRVVWCAKRGIGLIGSGSTNYRLLSDWYQENQKENLALLSPLHKIDVDLPLVYDPIHLRTWAKIAARVNASITLYRQSMKEGLMAEGHQIILRSNDVQKNIISDLRHAFLATDKSDITTRTRLILEIVKVQKDWAESRQKNQEICKSIKKIKRQNQLIIATAVVDAKDIDSIEYEHLSGKHILTDEERNQIDKYILKQKYGVEVTPALKLNDEKGYYCQILTHYYLQSESEYLRLRDKQEWYQSLYSGNGKVFLPDLSTYTLKVEALRALGVLEFIQSEREIRENDADLILMKHTVLQCSQQIKRILGINIIEQTSSIVILKKLLNLLGLKLKRVNQVYKVDQEMLNDVRQEVFEVWRQRDELMLMSMKNIEQYSSTQDVSSHVPTVQNSVQISVNIPF